LKNVKTFGIYSIIIVSLLLAVSCEFINPWYKGYSSWYGKWAYADSLKVNISGVIEFFPDSLYQATFSYWFTSDSLDCCDSIGGRWGIIDIGGPHDPDYRIFFNTDGRPSYNEYNDSTQAVFRYGMNDAKDEMWLERDSLIFNFILLDKYD